VTPAAPKDDPTIWRADDALWARLAPLLVVVKPRKKGSWALLMMGLDTVS